MTEADVECILVRTHEAHPDERPRIISDNGPQFIAKDFKEFIRLTGMTHVRTAPFYPQSNAKIERWHKTIKADAIRPGQHETLDEARALVGRWVEHYNTGRLHSAIVREAVDHIEADLAAAGSSAQAGTGRSSTEGQPRAARP